MADRPPGRGRQSLPGSGRSSVPSKANLSFTHALCVLLTKMPDAPRSPARFWRGLKMWTPRMFGCNLESGASEPHNSLLFEARTDGSIYKIDIS